MKKGIFLITLGLFFGLSILSSCGGGEDEAAKAKAKADSTAAAEKKQREIDSLAKVEADALQARLDSARIDSAERAGMNKGAALNKPTTPTKVSSPAKVGTSNATTTTTTTTTTSGGKLNVTDKPKPGTTGGKLNVK